MGHQSLLHPSVLPSGFGDISLGRFKRGVWWFAPILLRFLNRISISHVPCPDHPWGAAILPSGGSRAWCQHASSHICEVALATGLSVTERKAQNRGLSSSCFPSFCGGFDVPSWTSVGFLAPVSFGAWAVCVSPQRWWCHGLSEPARCPACNQPYTKPSF